MDSNEVIEMIKRFYPEDAVEIVDCLELLNLAFGGITEKALKEIGTLLHHDYYDEYWEITNLLVEIRSIQKDIENYISLLDIYDDDTSIDDEKEIDEDNPKSIPNYADYIVDTNVSHSLYEDFTHKKVSAFSLDGERFNVKDWKDLLLQTCNLLAEIDSEKFYALIDDPIMKGRKNSYFSEKYIEQKNVKMDKLDIYVWTNISANGIRNIVRKLLKIYNIKINEYYIFLRADYTPLHEEERTTENADTQDKIGRFVRGELKKLSNENYIFDSLQLINMQSKEWSKEVLDLNYPLLKPYNKGVSIKDQIRYGKYGRYWKELFEFNGQKFFATSQWFEHQRDKFDRWYATINQHKFI